MSAEEENKRTVSAQDLDRIAKAGKIHGSEDRELLKWFLGNWLCHQSIFVKAKKERLTRVQASALMSNHLKKVKSIFPDEKRFQQVLTRTQLASARPPQAGMSVIVPLRSIPEKMKRWTEVLAQIEGEIKQSLKALDSGPEWRIAANAEKEGAQHLALQILLYWRNQGRLYSRDDLLNCDLVEFSREVFTFVERGPNAPKLSSSATRRRLAAQFNAAMEFPTLGIDSKTRLTSRALLKRSLARPAQSAPA